MPLPMSLLEMLQIVIVREEITVGENRRLNALRTATAATWSFSDALFIHTLYLKFHLPTEFEERKERPHIDHNQRIDASIVNPDKPVG